MSPRAELDLRDYASRFLPGLQWMLLAADGRGHLHIDEQDEDIQEDEVLQSSERVGAGSNRAALFSAKNQWLWKLLVMPGLDPRYWGGPQRRPGSIGELASVSGVSQPGVSSFVSRAERAGFIKRVASGFQVERHQELLEDWGYAIKHGRKEELPLRFVYPEESDEPWIKKLRAFSEQSRKNSSAPALVIGYHLACHLVGLGRSNVRIAWLYSRERPAEIMSALNLAKADPDNAQLSLVVPSSPESLFGGFVWADGAPVCDVLQCYLDVRLSPARGMEQADFIMERILRPHFERRR